MNQCLNGYWLFLSCAGPCWGLVALAWLPLISSRMASLATISSMVITNRMKAAWLVTVTIWMMSTATVSITRT